MNRRRKALPILAGLLAVLAILALQSVLPGPFERLRFTVFDALQRAAPWDPPSSRVRVVDIDNESLRRIGQWPWPRDRVADLVRHLQAAGAAAVAFDVVFAEPDRTSPALLADDWRRRYGWIIAASADKPALPDHDKDLAAAFSAGHVVAGFALLPAANGAEPSESAGIATVDGDPAATLPAFSGAIPNIAPLDEAAAGHGSFTLVGGRDEIIRRLPLLFSFKGRVLPSLSLDALRVASDEDTLAVRAERVGKAGAVLGYTIRVGDTDVPIGPDGTLLLHHGRHEMGAPIPAWRALDGTAPDVKDRIVLIGTSATGLADLRPTPLNPLEPGVGMHARALDQILAGHFLQRPSWAAGAEVTAAVLLALLLLPLVVLANLRIASLAAGAALLGCGAAAWLLFARFGILADPSLPVLTLLAGCGAASFARYLGIERDAGRLRAAFMHYVSPELVKALARDPGRLKLGGELREMTFLFTDLEGFTHLTETIGPERLVALLNAYLEGLCGIALAHGGTVDKIVGDALHVMFNAPLDQPDHAERAVRCALAIDAFAEDFTRRRKAEGLPFGVTRIGINTGAAVVGNFGGGGRFDYTAHGDAINTAARLESANKALGTRICVAGSTADRVQGVAFLPVGTLTLKGKSEGVEVFAPESGGDWRDLYLQAFNRLRQGQGADEPEASQALVELHARHPENSVLALHARRIERGERSVRMAA